MNATQFFSSNAIPSLDMVKVYFNQKALPELIREGAPVVCSVLKVNNKL
ncbi:hypothetical protein HNQ91_002267 [Filimonas zeae]|nr:hypothetical protein [Filimonas zeae]